MKYLISALIRLVRLDNLKCLGTRLVTASADGTAKVHNVHTGECISTLTGEI